MRKLYAKKTIAAAIAAASILSLAACGGEAAAPVVSAGVSPAPVPTPALSAAPAPEDTPAMTPESTPEPSPEPDGTEAPSTDAPDSAPEPTPEPSPKPAMLGLGESDAVGDDFFADAAFFGNSLVDGLRMYGGITSAEFYAATSASIVNVETTKNAARSDGTECTLFEALTEKSHGKIYVLLGINEIGFEPDYFVELYSAMLSRLRALEPEADIYVMSLTPVTKSTSDASAVFNSQRIYEYNLAISRMADEQGYYFLDLYNALSDDFGYLPEAQTTDGIHLAAAKYPEWTAFLKSHHG